MYPDNFSGSPTLPLGTPSTLNAFISPHTPCGPCTILSLAARRNAAFSGRPQFAVIIMFIFLIHLSPRTDLVEDLCRSSAWVHDFVWHDGGNRNAVRKRQRGCLRVRIHESQRSISLHLFLFNQIGISSSPAVVTIVRHTCIVSRLVRRRLYVSKPQMEGGGQVNMFS